MKKILVLFLIINLILNPIFQLIYENEEMDHTCSGDDCEICLSISRFLETKEQVALATTIAFAVSLFVYFIVVAYNFIKKYIYSKTTIDLKVKLSL